MQGDWVKSVGKEDSFWLSYQGDGEERGEHDRVRTREGGGVSVQEDRFQVEAWEGQERVILVRHKGTGRQVGAVAEPARNCNTEYLQ